MGNRLARSGLLFATAIAAAGCCGRCPRASMTCHPPASAPVSAPAAPAPRAKAPTPAPAPVLAPDGAALAGIRDAKDDAARRRAIHAVRQTSPEGFLALAPDVLAGLAPDALRVYDLSETLADGGDAPAAPIAGVSPHGRESGVGPGSHTLARANAIAAVVRTAVGESTDEARTFVDVRPAADRDWVAKATHVCLVVLADAAGFERVESALDRIALAGGPVHRVEVEVRRKGPPAGSQPIRFAFHVARGREVATWRATSVSYVQDYDVHVSMGGPYALDPLIGTIVEGVAARAAWVEEEGREPQLRIRCDWSELVRPVATFDTTLGSPAHRVRIDLPEVRLRAFDRTIDVPTATTRLSGPLDPATLANVTVSPAPELETPSRPGWSRVAAGTPIADAPSAVDPRPLVHLGLRFETSAGPPAPSSLGVYAGQTAMLENESRISYVQDYDVDTRTGLANPVLGAATESVSVRLIALPSSTSGARVFDGTIRRKAVERPFPVEGLSLAPGTSPALVQLPVSHEVLRPFRVRLALGEQTRIPYGPALGGQVAAPMFLVLRYVQDAPGLDP